METIQTNTKEIVHQFAAAVKNQDFDSLSLLLAEIGEYHTQDKALETVEVKDSASFIKWLKAALSNYSITKVEFDQCLHCYIGNPVVMFNDGKFPSIIKGLFKRSLTGFMLNIVEGKINEIGFCYTFVNRENPNQIECLKPKIERLVSMGYDRRVAYRIALEESGKLNGD